jgi:geranylgeranyl pyrophosphate synthase
LDEYTQMHISSTIASLGMIMNATAIAEKIFNGGEPSCDSVAMLKKQHQCINEELAAVKQILKNELRTFNAHDAIPNALFSDIMSHGGKMLRPRLVLLSALALHGNTALEQIDTATRNKLLRLAVVVELVHTASLMHDDVLDQALIRRDTPSLNARLGDKVAILAGDILYSKAFEMLLDTAPAQTTRALITCVRHMCRGEVINLEDHGSEAYERIIDDKTAALMRFCCKAGAEISSASITEHSLTQPFAAFGHSFGMVYQLADDLSDGDVSDEVADNDRILSRLRHYTALADDALSSIPASIYRDGLVALLDFVVLDVESTSGSTLREPNNATCGMTV